MGVSIARGVSAVRPIQEVGCTCDGNGGSVSSGFKGQIVIPYPGVIKSWILMADIQGTCSVDIWKCAGPTYPLVGDSITASNFLTLTNQKFNEGLDVSMWSPLKITRNDIIGFNINTIDGAIGRLTILLKVI